MTYAHHREAARKSVEERASRYKSHGGDVAQDKALIKKAFRQHENAEHGGKHETILKRGGAAKQVGGAAGSPRADRKARGGSAHKGKGKGGKHPTVNVVVATPPAGGGDRPMPMPVPVPKPVPVPMGAGAGGPPPGMPPGGPGGMPPRPMGPPPGGPPPMMGAPPPMMPKPPGMAQRGGRQRRAQGGAVEVPMKAGAGGGKGRLEKAEAYGPKVRKKRGGACD